MLIHDKSGFIRRGLWSSQPFEKGQWEDISIPINMAKRTVFQIEIEYEMIKKRSQEYIFIDDLLFINCGKLQMIAY